MRVHVSLSTLQNCADNALTTNHSAGFSMAVLLETSTGLKYALKPYHVFGRSAQHADCMLPARSISMIHACVRWYGRQWLLTDQSLNGSFLNGARLTKDQATALQLGDELRFGSLESSAMKVIDVSAPADALLPLSLGQSPIMLKPFQNLPDDEAPQVCIYRAPDGRWLAETDDDVKLLNDGDLVHIGRHAWRLVCSDERSRTLMPATLISCMKFQSSLDEEHVSLSVTRGKATLDLGERSHHYLLLLLARQRLVDIDRGLDLHTQGWIEFDDLVQMLNMDKAHLNIQVFRLRKQFEEVVSQGLIQQDFIERRRGGLRLGRLALEICKGSQLESAWHPDAQAKAAA